MRVCYFKASFRCSTDDDVTELKSPVFLAVDATRDGLKEQKKRSMFDEREESLRQRDFGMMRDFEQFGALRRARRYHWYRSVERLVHSSVYREFREDIPQDFYRRFRFEFPVKHSLVLIDSIKIDLLLRIFSAHPIRVNIPRKPLHFLRA